jgi:hypothetical protein
VTPPKDQRLPLSQQSVFYQVVYPAGWKEAGLKTPHCNPCDHANEGYTTPTDIHDRVATRPEMRERRGFSVEPSYTGDPNVDAKIKSAYLAKLPAKSATQVNQLLAARLSDGKAIAKVEDLGFYFFSDITRL